MSPEGSDWPADALCRQVDPELFYPEPGRPTTRDAKRVCAGCPVRTECLTDALTRRDVTFGVRGGLAPRQRRQLLGEPAIVAAGAGSLLEAGAA